MRANDWLSEAIKKLVDIPTARLDSLVLLEDTTTKDRGWLLAHPEYELTAKQVDKLEGLIKRRSMHEPLAYIRGKSEFYSREFLVTPDTLQPRSETETMVDLLKELDTKGAVVADIGTGSGCLAITAKLEWPEVTVYATEINEAALVVAKKNAVKLSAEVKFFLGNLLEPVLQLGSTILLCNLPYVPDSHTINKAAMQEPKVAIFGGEDGLDLYRELFEQTNSAPKKPVYILTESLPFQHKTLEALALPYGYKQIKEEDFIQVFSTAD